MPAYDYVVDTGIIVPDTADLKTTVQGEYRTALGTDMVESDASPQGRLIDSEVTARTDVIALNAENANQINPNIAVGIFLKSICALMDISAGQDTPSTIPGVILRGAAETPVPAGSRIRSEATGNTYASVNAVTFDSTGMAVVDFQNTVAGPIPEAAEVVWDIVDGVVGWSSAENPAGAVLGSLAMNDARLRLYRKEMLAKQGVGGLPNVYSRVRGVAGVQSLKARENDSSSAPIPPENQITLPNNSMWVCVNGGADNDILTALLAARSGTPAFAQATAVGGGTVPANYVTANVVEPVSGQQYTVQFARPDRKRIKVAIYYKLNVALRQPEKSIIDAIIAYASGQLPDEPGFVTGVSVSPFDISGAVMIQIPGILVPYCAVWLEGQAQPVRPSAPVVPINLWEIPFIDTTDISVFKDG
ncbi:baseplate wedge subunit [Burkholderia phage Bm1]